MTEGSFTNILYYRNGLWQTPSAEFSMVQGVFRAFLLDKNLVQEGVLSRFLLKDVEALMLCNAIQGIIPVRSILGKEVNHSKEIIEEFVQQLNSTLAISPPHLTSHNTNPKRPSDSPSSLTLSRGSKFRLEFGTQSPSSY